jgi:hypothetical protein
MRIILQQQVERARSAMSWAIPPDVLRDEELLSLLRGLLKTSNEQLEAQRETSRQLLGAVEQLGIIVILMCALRSSPQPVQ